MAGFKCPHCGKAINIGSLLGKSTSEKKAKSSAENGKKGGRPRKDARKLATPKNKKTSKKPARGVST